MDLSTVSKVGEAGIEPVFKKKFDIQTAVPANFTYKSLASDLSNINFINEVNKAKESQFDITQAIKGSAASALNLTAGTIATNVSMLGRTIDEKERQRAAEIIKKRSAPDYKWYTDVGYLGESLTLRIAQKRGDEPGPMTKMGDALGKKNQEIINKYFARKPGMANQLVYDISGGLTSVGAGFGLMRVLRAAQAAKAVAMNTPSAWFAAQAAGEVAQTGAQRGATIDEQTKAYFQSAVPNFVIERVGLEYWVNSLKGTKLVERVSAGVVTNFAQESTQRVSDEVAMKLNNFSTNDWKTITQGAVYEGFIGAVAGGGVSAVDTIIQNRSIIGEMRALGLSDNMINDAFNEVNNLPDVVVEGDLTKQLITKGYDEVTAGAVEEKFKDIGYKQWMGQGIGQVVGQLRNKGLNYSESFMLAEMLVKEANTQAISATEEQLMKEYQDLTDVGDYQLAYEYSLSEYMKAPKPENMTQETWEQTAKSSAELNAIAAQNTAKMLGIDIEQVLNFQVSVAAEGETLYQGAVPDLKTTGEAVLYGESIKDAPEAIALLKNKIASIDQEIKTVAETDDFKAFQLAQIKGIYNEALRRAEGNEPENIRKMSDELIAKKTGMELYQMQAPVFYSQVEKVVNEKMPNAATPEMIKGILSEKNAVKKEEIEWMGVNEFLAGKEKVTKQELLDFINQNKVNLVDITKVEEEGTITVNSVDITPAMKESVMAGQTLFQDQPSPRAKIVFTPTRSIITLFSKADPSSIMHEMAHHWLRVMSDFMASNDAPPAFIQQYKVLSDFLGIQEGQVGITVEQHEKFARAFEAYLREGVAPKEDLKPIFEAFKQWLTDVYHTSAQLEVQLTPQVRKFFDTLLGAPDVVEGEVADDSDTSWQHVEFGQLSEEESQALLEAEMAQNELIHRNEIRRFVSRTISESEKYTGEFQDISRELNWIFNKKGGGVTLDNKASEFFNAFPMYEVDELNGGDNLLSVLKELFIVQSYKDVQLREAIKTARRIAKEKKIERQRAERKFETAAKRIEGIEEYVPTEQDLEAFAAGHLRRSVKAARNLAAKLRTQKMLDDTKKKYMSIIEQLRFKIKDLERIRKEIAAYARETLPKGYREKAMSLVVNAKGQDDLTKAFIRINEIDEDIQRSDVISEIRGLIEKIADSESIDLGYKQLAEKEIDRLNIKGHSKRTLDRIMRMKQWMDANPTSRNITDEMRDEIEILSRKNITDLTHAQLVGLREKLTQFYALGLLKAQKKQVQRRILKEQLIQKLREGTRKIESKTTKRKAGDIENAIADFENAITKMNIGLTFVDVLFDKLDGGKATYDGPNYRIFKAVTDHNFGKNLDIKDRFQMDIIKLAQDLKLTQDNFERIGIFAALQQEGGFEKLTATLDPDEMEMALKIELTEAERTWYEKVRQRFDEMRPMIEKIYYEEFNKPLGAVKDYFSFILDWEALDEVEVNNRFGEQAEEKWQELLRKNPNMKFTVTRKGGKTPIIINAMDIFLRHTDNVAYFLTMTKDNRLLYEIANSKEYKEIAGDIGASTVLKYLDLVARKGGVDVGQRIPWLDTIRRNIGVGTLGFKLSTIALQPTALIDTAAYIGNYAFKGATNILDPRWANLVLKFPKIRRRAGDDPAYEEFLSGKTSSDWLWLRRFREMGMRPIQRTDMWAAMAGAAGAYEKKMNELGRKIDFDKVDPEAMEYAQRIVGLTQSSGFFIDAPMAATRGELTGSLSRGRAGGSVSIDKLILQFSNFALRRFANIASAVGDIGRGDYNIALRKLFWYWMSTVVAVGLRAGIHGIKKFFTDDDEEFEYTKKLVGELYQQIPIAGGVMAQAYSGYKPSIPVPAISAGQNLFAQFPGIFFAAKPETRLRSAIRFAGGLGQLAGVPGSAEITSFATKAVPEARRARRATRRKTRKRNLK